MQGAGKRGAVVSDLLGQCLEYLGRVLVANEHFEHAIAVAVQLFGPPAFGNLST
jgi:hypothetical protein